MAELETENVETTDAATVAEEESQNTDEAGDTVVEPDAPVDSTPDYKAELEKVRQEERERAEKIIAKKAFQEREKRRELEATLGNETPEALDEMVSKKVAEVEQRFTAKLNENRLNELAARMSNDPSERELIIHHYTNSVVHSGNLEEDVKRAYAITNAPKLQSRLSELQKSAASKRGMSVSSEAGEKVVINTDKPTAEDAQVAKMLGISIVEAKEARLKTEKYRIVKN